MLRKKWKAILLWIGSIILLLLIAGYFMLNYVADKVLNAMIPQADEWLQQAPESSPKKGVIHEKTVIENRSNDAKAGQASSRPDEKPEASAENSRNSGSASTDRDTETSTYKAEISASKAIEVREQITFGEKLKLTTILLKKLSTDDLKMFSGLFDGGLTVEEKRKAKNIIMEKLSEDEYDELISIAKKYGLSKGKGYKDSLQEKGK